MSRVVDHSQEIRGVYIPIEGSRLILPNAAVAEVIGYVTPNVSNGTPDWFIGEIAWRNVVVPIVSFEQALGGTKGSEGEQKRIAIFNTLNGSTRLPFIGVIAKSIPRLVRINAENIVGQNESEQLSPLILQKVVLDGEDGLIPDLDHLEMMVAQALN
jgi:chemosensory pili system protein ChpC